MGLTERHWFEDEEPELTENQLEDILWENNKIFERGYQKGFSDALELLREQDPVEPTPGGCDDIDGFLWYTCPECDATIAKWDRYCRGCGRKVEWND